MKLLVPPINPDDIQGFSDDIDIFGRKKFGDSILKIIQSTDDPLTLALDGSWGEGKSTFIKMWKSELREKKYNCIYFDAFENDYQKDPFLAICTQIYNSVDDHKKNKKFKESAISAMKSIGRASVKIGIKTITANLLDDTAIDELIDIKEASGEISSIADKYISKILDDSKSDKIAIESFKTILSDIASDSPGGKIIFIIDELDRCKPNFALSLLENIKHFYSVPNLVFVLCVNRVQIEESIKLEYGQKIDAGKYLQKFISLWVHFPKETYQGSPVRSRYLFYCLDKMEMDRNNQWCDTAVDLLDELVSFYSLTLREIERILTNFSIIYNLANGFSSSPVACLSAFLSVLKVIDQDAYVKLSRGELDYDSLKKSANLDDLIDDDYSDDIEPHFIRVLLYLCLKTPRELTGPERQRVRSVGLSRMPTMSVMCDSLNNFSWSK